MTPKPISPEIIGEREKFLLYGKSKQGKTPLALTLPPPIYFLSVGHDNEAKVYYSKPFQEKFGDRLKEEDLLVDVGVNSQNCKDLAEKAIEDALSGKGPDFASIVVDNATMLIEMHMDVAMHVSHGMKEEAGKGTEKTALTRFRETGAIQMQKGDWGIAQRIMQNFVSDLISVDKHLAFVAHEYETYVAGPQQTQILNKVEPNFIGKDRTNICNRFDNVWRITRDGAVIIARTDAGNDPKGYAVVAGSRVGGVLGKDYIKPDLTKAIERFRKHAEEVRK